MGLAPTTSTTMQMALGDALAVALLTRRGFTAAEFHQFHPGGRLGGRLRRVRDLMHSGEAMPLAEPGLAMDRALLRITEKHFGCLGRDRRRRAGWPASSPTATCAERWDRICCRGGSARS